MRRATLLLALLLLGAPPARAEAPACGAPAEYLEASALPAVATGVVTGRLRVFATGSASVLGSGVSGEGASWPARLESLLRERRPDLDIRMEVRGGRGLTAQDQWRLIQEALRRGPVELVIWQAGATEAIRGMPLDDMGEVLSEGLAYLRARGVDVVLMDLQYSRFLRANADVEPYRETMRMLGAAHGAAFFRRYDLMRAWVEAGTVDPERAARERRTVAVDRLNDCLARGLAAFLRSGSREARR